MDTTGNDLRYEVMTYLRRQVLECAHMSRQAHPCGARWERRIWYYYQLIIDKNGRCRINKND